MIRISIGNEEYGIQFTHDVEKRKIKTHDKNELGKRITVEKETDVNTTSCFILKGKPGTDVLEMETVSKSTVSRHYKDRYCRKEARKFSLGEAVGQIPNRDVRTALYNGYWASRGAEGKF